MFTGCYALEHIEFPSTLCTLASQPFTNIPNLQIEFPNGNEYVRHENNCLISGTELVQFLGGEDVSEVYVPDGVRRLGFYSFGYSSATVVHLPETAKEIMSHCFNSLSKNIYIENPGCRIYPAGEDYAGSFERKADSYDAETAKSKYYVTVHAESGGICEVLCKAYGIDFVSTGIVEEEERYATIIEKEPTESKRNLVRWKGIF